MANYGNGSVGSGLRGKMSSPAFPLNKLRPGCLNVFSGGSSQAGECPTCSLKWQKSNTLECRMVSFFHPGSLCVCVRARTVEKSKVLADLSRRVKAALVCLSARPSVCSRMTERGGGLESCGSTGRTDVDPCREEGKRWPCSSEWQPQPANHESCLFHAWLQAALASKLATDRLVSSCPFGFLFNFHFFRVSPAQSSSPPPMQKHSHTCSWGALAPFLRHIPHNLLFQCVYNFFSRTHFCVPRSRIPEEGFLFFFEVSLRVLKTFSVLKSPITGPAPLPPCFLSQMSQGCSETQEGEGEGL